MSASTTQHAYSIKEAAALTGLPASTLRYYESIGVIAPVGRGESSRHRVYDESDLDQIMWVACLAATGLSVSDMKEYVANGQLGPSAAREQVALLTAQQQRLVEESQRLALRQRYVAIKIDYWHAVATGDAERTALLEGQARGLADALKRAKTH